MAVVVYTPKRRTSAVEIHLAGSVVSFRLAALEETGEAVMLAEITDPVVLSACRRMGYRVLDAAPALLGTKVAIQAAAGTLPAAADGWSYPPIVKAAFANGWEYEDITGAGNGDQWGIEGGRGLRSGLTMAELSLSLSPKGWAEKRATHWPWELLGWKAPGPGWKAPVLPGKRSAPDAVPDADEAPAPLAPAADDPDLDEDVGGDSLLGSEQDDPSPVEVAPAASAAIETRSAEHLATFPADQVTKALDVLKDVWTTAGKPPSPSKARHYLGKAGISPVTTEQVQALLDMVQISL